MADASAQDLNQLFGAALGFGASWRRPVADLATEQFPNHPPRVRDALSAAVEQSRTAIETHIGAAHVRQGGHWTRAEERRADAWIADQYPWMSEENRRRALGQGQYYAWHDHG